MKPLAHPFTYSFFNGTHDVIAHMAYPKAVRIGSYNRPWTFFVVAAAPCAVVIGLDAIRGWPLFYSPLDDRLFVADDFQGRGGPAHSMTNPLFEEELPSPLPSSGKPQHPRLNAVSSCTTLKLHDQSQ